MARGQKPRVRPPFRAQVLGRNIAYVEGHKVANAAEVFQRLAQDLDTKVLASLVIDLDAVDRRGWWRFFLPVVSPPPPPGVRASFAPGDGEPGSTG